MGPDLYEEISNALTATVGFKSIRNVWNRSNQLNVFCWWIEYDDIAIPPWPRPRERYSCSPTIPDVLSNNPCGEIPLDYTVYAFFSGDNFYINTIGVSYLLSDPKLTDKLIEDFKDLDKLKWLIDKDLTSRSLKTIKRDLK